MPRRKRKAGFVKISDNVHVPRKDIPVLRNKQGVLNLLDCLPGVPMCVNRLDWYFKRMDTRYPLDSLRNINFEGESVSFLDMRERVQMLEFVYGLASSQAIPTRIYDKMCQYALPDYVSSDDEKCQIYWSDYVSTW